MDIESLVIDNLKSLGINYELLRPKLKKQFIEIEEYVYKCSSIRLESLKNLKENDINIKKISDNTSISKATIYNNKDTLKVYIDKRISELKSQEENEGTFISSDKYTKLTNKFNETYDLLNNISIDLIHMNNLKMEIKILKDENDELLQRLDILSSEREALLSELNKLKKTLSILNADNVIDFRKTY